MTHSHTSATVVATSILCFSLCGLARTEDGEVTTKNGSATDQANAIASEGIGSDYQANNALGGLDFGEDEQEAETTNDPDTGTSTDARSQPPSVIPIPSVQSDPEVALSPTLAVTAFTANFFRTSRSKDRAARTRRAPELVTTKSVDRPQSKNVNSEQAGGDIPLVRGVPIDEQPKHSVPRRSIGLDDLKQGQTYRYLLNANHQASMQPHDASDIFRRVYDGAKQSNKAFENKGVGTSGVLGIKSMRDSSGFVRAHNRVSSKIEDVPSPHVGTKPDSTNMDSAGSNKQSISTASRRTVSVFLEKGVRMEFPAEMLARAELSDEALVEVEDRLLQSRTPDEFKSAVAWSTKQIVETVSSAFETRELSKVTAVSLRHLCEQAEEYKDRWELLPKSLRYPGSLRRILGFVVAPNTGDIFILGTTDGQCTPIDIDDIVVGLKYTWATGSFPKCSLDPDPADPGGPQWSRIEGIPMQTGFAQTMLDADHDMKKLIAGKLPCGVPGFENWPELASQQPDIVRVLSQARYWFRAADLPPGAIRVSPNSSVALFDSVAMVDTEIMANSSVLGASHASPGRHAIDAIITEFVNSHFDAFKRELPSFARLHSLFDVVLFSKLLRRAHPRNELLKRVTKLPVRVVDVRESYPGVRVNFDVQGKTGYLMGGVNMASNLRSNMIVRIADPRVERFAERLDSTEVSRSFDDPGLELSKTSSRRETDDSSGLTITEMTSIELARLHFTLAVIYHRAELYWLAERHLNLAREHGFLFVVCDELEQLIRYDRGDIPNLDELTEDESDALFRGLITLRWQTSDNLEQRLADIDVLLQTMPDDPPDYFGPWILQRMRASLLYQMKRFQAAVSELDELIKQRPGDYRALWIRSIAHSSLQQHQKAYDDAAAAIHVAGKRANATYYIQRAMALLEVDNTASEKLEADFRKAVALEPKNSDAHLFWARYLAFEGDIDGAIAACGRAIRYGHSPEAYYTRAALLLKGSRPAYERPRFNADGMKDLNVAIQLDPALWEARQLRGELLETVFRKGRQLGSDENLQRYANHLFDAYQNSPLEGEFLKRAEKYIRLGDGLSSSLLAVSATIQASVELCAWDFEQAAEYAPERLKKLLRQRAEHNRRIHRTLLENQEAP
jgi:tetratricopeptide (TPR) repeat protein